VNVSTTEVVVIGGGIMGATVLWELARRGVPALMLESGRVARESTGKSAAIVRMHYSNAAVVRMALRGREALSMLHERFGCAPVYHRTGWLFLIDEADADVARANRAMQIEQGSFSDVIAPPDLASAVPGIRDEGIALGILEEESGFADPVATTLAYVDAARREGATAREGSRVTRIEAEGGRVTGVVADGGRIACDRVVLAAGAWSRALAAGLDVDLPLTITREQDVVFDTAPQAPVPLAVSDQADRIYFRPLVEAGPSRMLAGRGFPKEYEIVEPDGYDPTVSDAYAAGLRADVAGRIPRMEAMRAVEGRVGLYAVTPDWHPFLGPVEGVDGLVLATGGSGHCFKLGPAIGEMVVAEMMGERVEYAEPEDLAFDRLARGRPLASTYGGNRA
jgi:sarcosine oxidase subunit beta